MGRMVEQAGKCLGVWRRMFVRRCLLCGDIHRLGRRCMNPPSHVVGVERIRQREGLEQMGCLVGIIWVVVWSMVPVLEIVVLMAPRVGYS